MSPSLLISNVSILISTPARPEARMSHSKSPSELPITSIYHSILLTFRQPLTLVAPPPPPSLPLTYIDTIEIDMLQEKPEMASETIHLKLLILRVIGAE